MMRLTCTVRLNTGSNMAAYLTQPCSSIVICTVSVNKNFMNQIRSRTGIQLDRSRSLAIVRSAIIWQLSVKSSGPLGVSPVLVSSGCLKNSGPPLSSPIKKSVQYASKLWSGPPQNQWLIIQYTVGLPARGRIVCMILTGHLPTVDPLSGLHTHW